MYTTVYIAHEIPVKLISATESGRSPSFNRLQRSEVKVGGATVGRSITLECMSTQVDISLSSTCTLVPAKNITQTYT